MTERGQRGFTLIELLIVVVIIGILAAIAIPKFSSVRQRALKSAMLSDLKNLAHLQEVYFNEYYSFASTLDLVGFTPTDGVDLVINQVVIGGWAATATHAGTPGEQCGLYHGNADPGNGAPASVPSVPMCSF